MKLISFDGGFGRVTGEYVIPMGNDLVAYLGGEHAVETGPPQRLSELRLQAPIPRPEKIIGVGLNYRDHAVESRQPIPDEPILFAKHSNAILSPGASIRIPLAARDMVDFEAELAVVIGRVGHRLSVANALDYVAGYTCANDVTSRDLQIANGQWFRGKSADTYLPLGPSLVTADEIPDPQTLAVSCAVNGQVMQESNTAHMIFSVAQLLSFISQTVTLVPGDVICTGTPPGVGFARTPPRFLRAGDEVTISIQGIGELTNSVADEEA